MSKIILTVITVVSIIVSSLIINPTLEAVKLPNTKAESSQVKSKNTTESSTTSSANTKPTKKSKAKIINGELDVEPDVVMTKEQKQEFNQCKKEEKSRRSKRNKNKPTTCFKIPEIVHESLTNQTYTTLFDQIQEKKELDDKKDMNKELPLSDFVNVNDLVNCQTNESSSSTSSAVSSITLSSSSKSNISSIVSSSQNECDQESSSSSISSTSNSSSSSSLLSSSLSSSSSNSSSNQSLISSTSSSIISSSNPTSINSNSTSSAVSVSSNSSSSQSSVSTISFLDMIFGSVKTEAAGIVSNGYRLPYPSGTRMKTNRVFNQNETHLGHNALDFYSIDNNNSKYNADIVAVRSGTIYLSNPSTSISRGLGNNYVIKQDDGNYALYAHLSSRDYGVGQKVTRGQKIGVQGDTGTYDPNFNNSHLHFEVLQPGILDYNSGCKIDFNNCYNAFALDQYKVTPQYDECFRYRGGDWNDEHNCTLNGANQGYPYKFQSANYWTSINTPSAFLKSASNGNLLFDIYGGAANNQDKVLLWDYNGGYNNQRWNYNSNNQTITTAVNSKCLDGGNVNDPNNRWIRVNDCNGGNNQKWLRGRDNTLRPVANNTLCVDSASGNVSNSVLHLWSCHGGYNQKWAMDDFNTMNFNAQDLPVANQATQKYTFRMVGTNYCLDDLYPSNGRAVYVWDCFNLTAQTWDWVSNNNSSNAMIRRSGTNSCLDAYNPSNGRDVYTWPCDPNASNHNWYYNSSTKQIKNMSNTNFCIDAYNPSNGRKVYTYQCDNSNNQKWEASYQGTW